MPNYSGMPILLAKGHRTKAEIKSRMESEKSFCTDEAFRESAEVKLDRVAHIEFLRLKRLYSKIGCTDALDQGILNRYCLLFAEYKSLLPALRDVVLRLEEAKFNGDSKEITKLYNMRIIVHAQIYKSEELLLKYENALFMNPLSRMRAIPKTSVKKEEAPTGVAAFKARRANNAV